MVAEVFEVEQSEAQAPEPAAQPANPSVAPQSETPPPLIAPPPPPSI
jgi:hypothetical protein